MEMQSPEASVLESVHEIPDEESERADSDSASSSVHSISVNASQHGEDSLLAGLYNASLAVFTSIYQRRRAQLIERSLHYVSAESRLENQSAHDAAQNTNSSNPSAGERSSRSELQDSDLLETMSSFVLWGDVITTGAAEATDLLFPALHRTLHELLLGCAKLLAQLELLTRVSYPCTALSTLDIWIERASFSIEDTGSRNLAESSDNVAADSETDSDTGSTSSTTSEVDQDTVFERLADKISLLMDLVPSISDVVRSSYTMRSIAPDFSALQTSLPAQPYISQISDNYSDAPIALVKRLGEANWQRFCKLRLRQDETVAAELGQAKSIFHVASTAFRDSAIGTSLASASASRPEDTQSSASHSSFVSTAINDSHHYNRVPKEPPEIALGKPFDCPVCGLNVPNVRNRVQFK